MILIKSISNDYSTTHVIKYLAEQGIPFFRVNEEKIVTFSLTTAGVTLELSDGRTLCLQDISAYWYRRGSWRFAPKPKMPQNRTSELLTQHIKQEHESLLAFLQELLRIKGNLSDQESARQANKLKQMQLAKAIGLTTPEYIVTGNKTVLQAFLQTHPQTITKAFDHALPFLAEQVLLPSYTTAVTLENLALLPEEFAPSMFQQMIPKRLEIRSFYLAGKIFSMAIFSQLDPKTAVDFRHYNWRRPNRNVPFKLPHTVERHLHRFMEKMPFSSGSFDLILTPDNEYYFLELNPVGQFGMVSIPCNYYLEKRIANHLIHVH
ncbi:MAG: grasp-with-spasm system ATP-grasp peptide maturase [Lewinellaceae bacterium]|nr:grasp-with-spasm system ATP-grasp peptide maturase [Lewinellaceae bacterium]